MADPPEKFVDPSELHVQFVRESREIDMAHHEGRLHEWLREKLDEQRGSGSDGRSSTVA